MQKIFIGLSIMMMAMTGILDARTAQKKASLTPSLTTIIETKADAYDQFLQASYLHAKGDTGGALKSFDTIMKTHSSPHMLEPYLQALFDGERFDTLVNVYEDNKKHIEPTLSKNYMTKAFIAQAYLATKKENKAQQLFDELISERGNDVQMCYFIAVGYLKTKHYQAAIKLLQDCTGNKSLQSKHYLFHFLLSKAYLESNRPKEAMASIELSIAQFPKFDRGWLFKAILHEQQGKIDDAIKGYKKFLDLTGRDQSIEKQLVQLLFSQQRFGEAADYLKKLSDDAPEYCFDLAIVQAKSGKYEEALPTINKVLAHEPTSEKARLLKIEILMNSNKTDEALSTLQMWLTDTPNNFGLLHTFFLLRQGGVAATKLMTTLEAVHARHQNNLGITAALGDLALDAGQPTKALEFYAQATASTSHKKLKSKIYFQRCYIFFDQKNISALIAELDKAEQEGCTNHALLNLRAYHLAQEGKDLAKALATIEQALTFKPDVPAYLDTKAYVLNKMNKSTEALHFAQKALSLAPDDNIIKRNVEELKRAQQPKNKKKNKSVRSSR